MIDDIMVLGGGIAGVTAAAQLRGKGHRVVLIDQHRHDEAHVPQPEWISAQALPLLDPLAIDRNHCVGAAFAGAVFHNADLTRSAVSPSEEPSAYRVDYGQLVRQFDAALRELGVERVAGATVSQIDVGEDRLTARFQERDPLTAKFMVMAEGAGEGAHGPADMDTAWVAQIQRAGIATIRDEHMHWVLGLEDGRSLLSWWFEGSMLVIQFHAVGQRDAIAQRLIAILVLASKNGLLSKDLAIEEAEITWRRAPTRFSLEFDSHVGKRSVLIGDAGGFVSAASREGIYPAMWSAQVAADVVTQALKSRHPQDELRLFNTRWRTAMAEYLRPPTSETGFLLPLIFSNQQMADRMAAACWRGENI